MSVRWTEFAREIGDKVCVTRYRKTMNGTVVRVGRIGFVVRLDDGTETWRHCHEVYDREDGHQPSQAQSSASSTS